MHAAAGSGRSGDGPGEIDRHARMLARLAGGGGNVTLLLRCASSVPAAALIASQAELARAGVRAQAIVAKLEPDDDLRALFACLRALAPHEPAPDLIRFARNPRLHDAHEQATYGETMCWVGDAMRRDAERRNALSLFHDEGQEAARAARARGARAAFAALWAASVPVPQRHLTGSAAPRPLGEYERSREAFVALSPLQAGPQGWPLIRH